MNNLFAPYLQYYRAAIPDKIAAHEREMEALKNRISSKDFDEHAPSFDEEAGRVAIQNILDKIATLKREQVAIDHRFQMRYREIQVRMALNALPTCLPILPSYLHTCLPTYLPTFLPT